MNENEVILLDSVPAVEYEKLLNSCVRYAILSFPFTVNRMNIESVKQRILNIAKGKIAEALFWFFCKHNHIRPDFKSCATAYWEVDKKDFILDGDEWDIKNNFIYHTGSNYKKYTHLPALVPNRFDGDQWSKRSATGSLKVKGARYLFTFLKNAGLTKFREREQEFLELLLSPEQEQYLTSLYNQYKGKAQRKEPYPQDLFWEHLADKGPTIFYKLHSRPVLVITGYADKNSFPFFKDTGPGAPFHYQEYILPAWYTRSATRNSSNFLNGTLWTTIKNATCPVKELPSFLSLFPHLENGIAYGCIKKF